MTTDAPTRPARPANPHPAHPTGSVVIVAAQIGHGPSVAVVVDSYDGGGESGYTLHDMRGWELLGTRHSKLRLATMADVAEVVAGERLRSTVPS